MSFIIENGVLEKYRYKKGEVEVVIPDGVLFGSSRAHKAIRKDMSYCF